MGRATLLLWGTTVRPGGRAGGGGLAKSHKLIGKTNRTMFVMEEIEGQAALTWTWKVSRRREKKFSQQFPLKNPICNC